MQQPEISDNNKNYQKVFSIVIGVNRYVERQGLRWAESDARSFLSEYLVDVLSRAKERGIHRDFFNETAQEAAIKEALNDIAESSDEGDLVFFYYAGHGSLEKPLILLDSDLRLEELREHFERIAARYIFVFIDACHSGQVLGMVTGETAINKPVPRKTGPDKRLEKIINPTTVSDKKIFVFASCTKVQLAHEVDYAHSQQIYMQQGLFTHYLLRALTDPRVLEHVHKEYPSPPTDKYSISLYQVIHYVREQVTKRANELYPNAQQTPVFSPPFSMLDTRELQNLIMNSYHLGRFKESYLTTPSSQPNMVSESSPFVPPKAEPPIIYLPGDLYESSIEISVQAVDPAQVVRVRIDQVHHTPKQLSWTDYDAAKVGRLIISQALDPTHNVTDFVVRAIATHPGYQDSEEAIAAFTLFRPLPAPIIVAEGQVFNGEVRIEVKAHPLDVLLSVTTDGQPLHLTTLQPSGTGNYPLTLTQTAVVKAVARYPDPRLARITSPVAEATFTRVMPPTITPEGGFFTTSTEVIVSASQPESVALYVSTNGKDPTTRRYERLSTDGSCTVPLKRRFFFFKQQKITVKARACYEEVLSDAVSATFVRETPTQVKPKIWPRKGFWIAVILIVLLGLWIIYINERNASSIIEPWIK